MSETYSSPRFICKSILRTPEGWMVTFPDYEGAGENPFSVRESSRQMDSEEMLEWVKRRAIRIGGVVAKPLIEQVEIPDALEIEVFKPSGARIRTTDKLKKLKCGHMMPRRKGAYPRRCPDCQKHFDARVDLMKKRMK